MTCIAHIEATASSVAYDEACHQCETAVQQMAAPLKKIFEQGVYGHLVIGPGPKERYEQITLEHGFTALTASAEVDGLLGAIAGTIHTALKDTVGSNHNMVFANSPFMSSLFTFNKRKLAKMNHRSELDLLWLKDNLSMETAATSDLKHSAMTVQDGWPAMLRPYLLNRNKKASGSVTILHSAQLQLLVTVSMFTTAGCPNARLFRVVSLRCSCTQQLAHVCARAHAHALARTCTHPHALTHTRSRRILTHAHLLAPTRSRSHPHTHAHALALAQRAHGRMRRCTGAWVR